MYSASAGLRTCTHTTQTRIHAASTTVRGSRTTTGIRSGGGHTAENPSSRQKLKPGWHAQKQRWAPADSSLRIRGATRAACRNNSIRTHAHRSKSTSTGQRVDRSSKERDRSADGGTGHSHVAGTERTSRSPTASLNRVAPLLSATPAADVHPS